MPDTLSDTAPSADPERRFGGITRLYGAAAAARFARAHVCVIGIGGVGSWAVEALARSGVGRLTLIDLDHVAESNVNRQVHALDATLGQAKVQAMGARVQAINPACTVTPVDDFIDPDNCATLLAGGFDHVVDAIDHVRAKVALIAHCRRQGLALVTVGGAGGRSDPGCVRVADLARTAQDPLLAKVRQRLRKAHGFPRDPRRRFGVPCVYADAPLQLPPGARSAGGLSCAGLGSAVAVTATFGLFAAAHVLAALAADAGAAP